jgi:hypothetical protein
VGGGIASMAAAAFMIRDGDILGRNITIIEETDRLGGSLDGAGSAVDGYVLRGGRMIERKYLCTYDLFSSIPTLDDSKTVTQEIFDWNETMKTSSKSRLVRDGHREVAPKGGSTFGNRKQSPALTRNGSGTRSTESRFRSIIIASANDRTALGAEPATSPHFERPLSAVWSFSAARALCLRPAESWELVRKVSA